jgi:hypothetical protein
MKYILYIICAISVSSCGLYRQNVINVPIVQKKGQLQVGSHLSLNGCFDGQASFTPTNKLTLLANYSAYVFRNGDVFRNIENVNGNHHFIEVGTGYYQKKKNGRINDIFLLVGNGYTSKSIQTRDTLLGSVKSNTNTQAVNYNRFVLQADIIKKYKNNSIAFTPRILAVNYYNAKDDGTNIGAHNSNTYFYTEGAMTFGVNAFRSIYINGQIGLTVPITGGSLAFYEFSPINCSVGLTYSLNIKKNKKEPIDL